MKKFINIILVLSLLFIASTASAKGAKDSSTMYAKLSLGYAGGSIEDRDFDYSGFEIVPAVGFVLPVLEDTEHFTLAIEPFIGLTFGDGDESKSGYRYDYDWDYDVTVINPGAMCILNFYFGKNVAKALQKLVPYGGAGLSTPIKHYSIDYTYYTYDADGNPTKHHDEWSKTKFSVKLNSLVGARYDFTDNFSALVEANIGIFGDWIGSFRIGGMYRF